MLKRFLSLQSMIFRYFLEKIYGRTIKLRILAVSPCLQSALALNMAVGVATSPFGETHECRIYLVSDPIFLC